MKTPLAALAVFMSGTAFFQANAQNDSQPINTLQVIGSHNSYKNAIEPALFAYLDSKDATHGVRGLQYEHISIPAQLDLGLRNLEIDIYADSKGGKFANPKGLELAKPEQAYDPKGAMKQPGFKVLHVPDIDFRSSVATFEACLQMLKQWSDAHPDHEPIFITLEPKDGTANTFGTAPEPFTEALFDEMDAVLKNELGTEKLITPDDVRGKYATLEQAVLRGNWPKLKDARGKFLIVLDNGGEKRDLYKKGHPSLKGRMVFINAAPGTPEAATLFRNNPEDPTIAGLVKQGYLIRTRADADTKEARANDTAHFQKAQASGAQIITTDYYQPSRFFDSPYKVQFEDGSYVRNNPVNGAKK